VTTERKKMFFVGDNPFHGISHLSDDRARARSNKVRDAEYAAQLVASSFENGADGFMFSVSEITLSILQRIKDRINDNPLELYAIVPYAYEYVRLATQLGTVGLGRKLAAQVIFSGNVRAILTGLKGAVTLNPAVLLETYLTYEVSRIKAAVGKKQNLGSILLHEVITDMALALDLEWLFKSYMHSVHRLKIKPGFETRNFAYLVDKFREWKIDFSELVLVTSFNKIGFQMNPSKVACEKALAKIPECDVIAMSILAAGYLRLPEAVKYFGSLPNLKGAVVGVSKERHASETFSFLKQKFSQINHS
jgi:hypothetical protein